MIRHAVIYTFDGLRYMCNYAVGMPNIEKIAFHNKELTCKNCIKLLSTQAERCGYHFSKNSGEELGSSPTDLGVSKSISYTQERKSEVEGLTPSPASIHFSKEVQDGNNS